MRLIEILVKDGIKLLAEMVKNIYVLGDQEDVIFFNSEEVLVMIIRPCKYSMA